MRTFLKVAFLLGLMVAVLLCLPGIASSMFGGLFSGLAALALLVLGSVLFLGLAIVGGGAVAVIALALLLVVGCIVAAVVLPVALPVLVVAGFITIVVKLVRLAAGPRATAVG